ncbi:acyl-CoA carboxylase subunit beta [Vineibacter terrae]|uniref:acyl-CoA carboxylase subunit beta n=1 Tax=Vineibacter terrae TaxID=2586908 RepID=UPI002E30345C|nr:carboxyl transferase domain-containing protein [Vineibacter terrae]HEX2892114.1 carboxyl transferase domain-containing protein [Vineibacter terrae]
MSFDSKLAEFERRRDKALAMGSARHLAARKAQGILNARERVAHLVAPGSFEEFGLFATGLNPAMRERTPTDAAVCGFGSVDGRLMGINSADFSTMAASSGRVQIKKYNHIRDLCIANGHPLINLMECGGGRIPDVMGASGIGAGGESGRYFRPRIVPTAAGVLGATYGRGAFVCVLSDFTVMRRGAVMAVSSPNVTSSSIAEAETPEDLGGWPVHSEVTGLADLVVDSDEEALDAIRRFLSYLPDHHRAAPPRVPVPAGADDAARRLPDLVPDERRKTYDVRRAIEAIVDPGSFFALKERFARAAVTGLARLGGQTVGVIATNPRVKGGALDAEACSKITSFIVLCDSFNVPLILMADTPGFLIGGEAERRGMAGRIMNFLAALEEATVPKLALVLRKSFGQAYINMGGGKGDETAAWFSSEISFMDPQVAVSVVFAGRQDGDGKSQEQLMAEVAADTTPYNLAAPYLAHAVIDPRDTRAYLISRLAIHSRALTGGIGEHRLANWPPMSF